MSIAPAPRGSRRRRLDDESRLARLNTHSPGGSKSVFRHVACLLALAVWATGCDSVSNSTTAERHPDVQAASKPLVVMTYNVLADPVAPERRATAIGDIIRTHQPDIIALQEVAPWFLKLLLANSEIADSYQIPNFDGADQCPGGQLVLSRHPIIQADWTTLSGPQRRTAVAMTVSIEGRQTVVATTHMESPLEAGNVRAQQLRQLFQLAGTSSEVLVLGDFNFGDGELEEREIPSTFVDAWTMLHPDDPGFTWDIERSLMAKRGSFPNEPSRRIDRVLIRSQIYQSGTIKIVGDQPLSEGSGLFPSDHFGLVATIVPKQTE